MIESGPPPSYAARDGVVVRLQDVLVTNAQCRVLVVQELHGSVVYFDALQAVRTQRGEEHVRQCSGSRSQFDSSQVVIRPLPVATVRS